MRTKRAAPAPIVAAAKLGVVQPRSDLCRGVGIAVALRTALRFALPLITASASAAAFAQKETTLLLLCEAKLQDRVFTQSLRLNYTRSMVNDSPATYTDTEIKWTTSEASATTGRVVYTDHRLDRLASRYTRWSRGEGFLQTGPGPSYLCRKAPPAQF